MDVRGGVKLKEYYQERALSIFVKVPSLVELEKRLRERGTDSEDSISKRVFKMKFEMAFQDQFDVILVNDDLTTAFRKAQVLFEEFIRQ